MITLTSPHFQTQYLKLQISNKSTFYAGLVLLNNSKNEIILGRNFRNGFKSKNLTPTGVGADSQLLNLKTLKS